MGDVFGRAQCSKSEILASQTSMVFRDSPRADAIRRLIEIALAAKAKR